MLEIYINLRIFEKGYFGVEFEQPYHSNSTPGNTFSFKF
jgi:hypothetical protein